jgi:uncharacterized protein (PEP-CTERM system associated)
MLRSDEYKMISPLQSGRFGTGWRLRFWLFLLAPVLLSAALPETAFGATLRITPSVDVTESYTDNVLLASEGAEADLITQTQADFNFTASGARVGLNLNLGAAHDYYLDTDGLNGLRPQALGTGDVELLKDHFFIDGSVSLSETSTQRNGDQSAIDRNLPSNRAQLLLYEISPRLVNRFGRLLEATLEYRHSESKYSKPAAGTANLLPVLPTQPGLTNPNRLQNQNEKSDDISLSLDTGRYFSSFNSQLILEKSTRKGKIGNKLTEDRVDWINEYQIIRQLAIIARAGYEDVGDTDSTLSNRGATGSLGFHVKPGPRIDLRAEYGKRFGEGNISADLTYKISSFYVLNASVSQSVQTQTSSRLNQLNRLIVDDSGRLVDPFSGSFRNPGDSNFGLNNGSFREDLVQIGLTGTRGRNTINLSADLSSRESAQNTSKEDQLSVNLRLSRRLQPRLSGNLDLSYSDTLNGGGTTATGVTGPLSLNGNNGGERYQSDATLEYQLGESLSSNLGYSYLTRKNGFSGDVSENVVSISINAQF